METYLRTSYSPECDYVDGEVRERCCGMGTHSAMLGAVAIQLVEAEQSCGAKALVLLSVKVSAKRVRIAEICLVERKHFERGIATLPPMLCVEVFQDDDTWEDQAERVRDFVAMGVPSVWVIDPYAEKAYFADADGLLVEESTALRAHGWAGAMNLKELFAEASR